jgi:hypothetical protein
MSDGINYRKYQHPNLYGQATIHDDTLARNVLGSGSREKTNDRGDVFWFAKSSHRDRRLRTLQQFVGKGYSKKESDEYVGRRRCVNSLEP